MSKLFNKEVERAELQRRVGNISQIASIKPYEMSEGKAHGLKAFDVSTGSGLDFTLLEGKCLDISSMKYKGVNLSFLSKPGLVSPEFFSPKPSEFPRNFQAGMLYTCGLTNVGPGCNDSGNEYCMHGRIGHIPAGNISARTQWMDNEYVIEISGEMREAALFGENLVLKRRITTSMGAKAIKIHDEVENQGFEEQALLILYHFNMGYPLLDEGTKLVLPCTHVVARDEEAARGIGEYNSFTAPIDHFKEQVFYHEVASDGEGNTFAALVNEALGLGLYIKYNTAQLPKLIEWKSMMSGDYVLGIEPANCLVESRVKERERGTLKYIAPFEKRCFDLEIGVLDGEEEIWDFEERVRRLVRL